MSRLILFLCLVVSLSALAKKDPLASFHKFADSIDQLPTNRELSHLSFQESYRNQHVVRIEEVTLKLKRAVELYDEWIQKVPQINETPDGPLPYVARLTLPANAEVMPIGDCHGDPKSIIAILRVLNSEKKMDGFKIVDPNMYLLFLGDFVDRGFFGLEVLAMIGHLKMLNPSQVLLLHGNHEDLDLNAKGGFIDELTMASIDELGRSTLKNPQKPEQVRANFIETYRLFCDSLPSAIFLRVGEHEEHVLAVHGGIEFRHNPARLLHSSHAEALEWLTWENASEFADAHQHELSGKLWSTDQIFAGREILYLGNGYQWHDFTLNPDQETYLHNITGRYQISRQDAAIYLSQHKIIAILRGHQHGYSTMKPMGWHEGILHHWHSPEKTPKLGPHGVFTFSQGADSIFCKKAGIHHAVYGSIRFSGIAPEDWQMSKGGASIPGITPESLVLVPQTTVEQTWWEALWNYWAPRPEASKVTKRTSSKKISRQYDP